MTEPRRFGLSGRLAAAFQANPLTPILALLGLLLGLVAVLVTPREEEPQIDVTMANVFVPFAGASARDVEQLVSTPLEQKLSEIEGVKHVYSVSRPGMAVLTVEYTVGVERQPAIVRLYNQVYSNQDWLPQGVGVGQPLVKPKGIDDVPILSVTLWTRDPQRGAYELRQVAHAIEAEIKRVPGTRNVYTIGGPDETVHVSLLTRRFLSLKGYAYVYCGGAHPDGFPVAATFDLTRGTRVELEDLYRVVPVPAGLDEASATATIETLQRYGELDEVVVVAVVPRRGELAILGQRCAGGVDRPVQCTAVVEVGFPDPSGLPAAARAAWRDLATGQLRYPLTLSADPRLGRAGGGPADPARCRWCRSPWLWASLSAVLVAAGVTALVATDDGTTTFELGIDPADWTR